MRYIELFAGVGGFRYGIDKANELTEGGRQGQSELEHKTVVANPGSQPNERQNTLTCVYSNEWNKYANSVYRKHYGECDDRDIRTVPTSDIPDHDLLVGGFPCQAFSVAGKRGGFNDTRGTLFFEIARILKDKRPRYLLLENVKGLLSHDNGKTFQTILGVLSDLGYGVQWQVLNSKDFGVPQNRERVFIVGHLRGTPRPKVFPLTKGSTTSDGTLGLHGPRQIAKTLRATDYKGTHNNIREIAIPVLTPDRAEKRQNGRRFKTNGEPSFTLTGQDKHGVYDGMKIRRLTPLECERLQGFEDGWTQYGADGEKISDTQRYKMMGNAVTTNVVTEVARKLI